MNVTSLLCSLSPRRIPLSSTCCTFHTRGHSINIFFTASIPKEWGRYCFHRSLFTWAWVPHLHSIILPSIGTMSFPVGGYPSAWSNVPGRGGGGTSIQSPTGGYPYPVPSGVPHPVPNEGGIPWPDQGGVPPIPLSGTGGIPL